MMNSKYALVVKTGDAEFRALENLSQDAIGQLFPIIEITRGRKLPEKKEDKIKRLAKNKPDNKEWYPFASRISKIKEIFAGNTICLDLTSDQGLSNNEIDALFSPEDGYKNWVDFLVGLKDENVFESIIPCILLNADDPNFNQNLLHQVQQLKEHFEALVYRSNLFDLNCYNDINLLKNKIENTKLYVMIDCGYILPAAHKNFSEKAIARISNLRKILSDDTKYILSATSFPKSISDMGDDYSDTFKLLEINVFNDVSLACPGNLIYSDYGSVNPVRNDDIPMSRGWIPRIDVALSDKIYYYRKRRPKGTKKYLHTYIGVARLVLNDERFPKNLQGNWGVIEIIKCANEKPTSTSPSFWISVRMNMHIDQQLKRLHTI